MDEQTWLASDDPQALLAFLTRFPRKAAEVNVRNLSDRKLRLFACSCARQVWNRRSHDDQRGYAALERFADSGDENDLRGFWILPLPDATQQAYGLARYLAGSAWGASPATQAAL